MGDEVPTAFFLIRANSWDDAMGIGEACPHLRYGGVVAVRALMTQGVTVSAGRAGSG